MTLRLGLAGLGRHGRRYAEHLLRGDVPGARLTAVSRADEERGREFARRHGVAFVADPLELAARRGVDAVVLCLPPHLHPAAAAACVERDRPLLVEKPMTPDTRSAARLSRAVAARGAFLMVGQTLRWDGVVRALARELPAIGALRTIAVNQRFEPSGRAWIDLPGSGGLFLNTGVHGFDLLRFLSGAEPVHVDADSARHHTRRTEDAFAALVRLEPGGVLALVDNTRASRSRSGRIELVGETGQLWGDHVHRTLCRVRDRQAEQLGPLPPDDTIPLVLASFVDAVREGREPPCGVEDGRAAVELVEAAERAAREARRVYLDEIRREAAGGS